MEFFVFEIEKEKELLNLVAIIITLRKNKHLFLVCWPCEVNKLLTILESYPHQTFSSSFNMLKLVYIIVIKYPTSVFQKIY